jgi:hypothetical protein
MPEIGLVAGLKSLAGCREFSLTMGLILVLEVRARQADLGRLKLQIKYSSRLRCRSNAA